MRSRASDGNPFSLFAFQDIITSVTGIVILVTMILALELVHSMASSPRAKTVEIADAVGEALAQNQREIEQLRRIVKEGAQSFRFDSDSLRAHLKRLRSASRELQLQNAQLTEQLQDAADRREQIEKERQSVNPDDLQTLREELQTARRQLENLKESNRVIFNRPRGEAKAPWLVQIEQSGILAAEVGKSAKPLRFTSAQEFSAWAETRNSSSIYFVLLLKPSGVAPFEELRKSLRKAGFDVGYDLLAEDRQAIDAETGAGVW